MPVEIHLFISLLHDVVWSVATEIVVVLPDDKLRKIELLDDRPPEERQQVIASRSQA